MDGMVFSVSDLIKSAVSPKLRCPRSRWLACRADLWCGYHVRCQIRRRAFSRSYLLFVPPAVYRCCRCTTWYRYSFMLGCRSSWKGQQTIPLRLTLSPKCSAAILGATVVFTASKIVIGISPFNISDKFLYQLNIRRKSLRPKKSGGIARNQKSPPVILQKCKYGRAASLCKSDFHSSEWIKGEFSLCSVENHENMSII